MWRDTEVANLPFKSLSDNLTMAFTKAEITKLKNVEFEFSNMYTEI